MCKLPTPCKLQICCIVAAIFTALTGALSSQPAAHAQGADDDYVDIGLTLETIAYIGDPKPTIIVVNNGSRTAYDVVVVVDLVSPEKSHFNLNFQAYVAPVGSVSLESNDRSLRWTIPALRGRQREVLTVDTNTRATSPSFDNSRYVHEFYGEVTTSSFESSIHEGNNTSRIWTYRYETGSNDHFQARGNYTVNVSVDKPSPSPGDTVNFTITADRIPTYTTSSIGFTAATPPPIDLKVDIELTDGLEVTGTPTYASGPLGTSTVPDSVSYSNGVFNIGTLKGGTQLRLQNQLRTP